MDLEMRRQEMNQALEALQQRYGLRLVAAQQVETLNETVTQTRAVLVLVEMPGWRTIPFAIDKVELTAEDRSNTSIGTR